MAKTTILFSSAMTSLPPGFVLNGTRNFLASFQWGGVIIPRTSDGFLLLDDPRHNAGTRQFPGVAIVAEIVHHDGRVTKAIDGAQLTWQDVSIDQDGTVNFDFVFIDGEAQRKPAGTYNDFWQFEALSGGAGGINVLGEKTQYHSLKPGVGSSVRNGRYVWYSRSFAFDAPFRGDLRWTVGNGQRVRKGTGVNAAASMYPSALALDFISIT